MSRAAWIVLVAAVLLAISVYAYRRRSPQIKVEPHAAEEIEKAKRR
jgi:hypothetical protein